MSKKFIIDEYGMKRVGYCIEVRKDGRTHLYKIVKDGWCFPKRKVWIGDYETYSEACSTMRRSVIAQRNASVECTHMFDIYGERCE